MHKNSGQTRQLRTVLAALMLWRSCGHRVGLLKLWWGIADTHADALTDLELDLLIDEYKRRIVEIESKWDRPKDNNVQREEG